MITFTVHGQPIALPRGIPMRRGKFASIVVPKEHPVHRWKREVARACTADALLTKAVWMKLTFVMKRPKAKMWKTKEMPRYAHACKPDLDNLIKAAKDALSEVLYKDDAQVWSMSASKVVADGEEGPHLEIQAYEEDA